MIKLNLLFIPLFALFTSCASSDKSAPSMEAKKAVETKAEEAKPAMTKALAETQKKPEMAKKMDATKIVCQSGKDTRDLSVMKTESGGCELHYSKFGQSNVVATARNGSEHCEEILNRIKGKLEEAKFSCQ